MPDTTKYAVGRLGSSVCGRHLCTVTTGRKDPFFQIMATKSKSIQPCPGIRHFIPLKGQRVIFTKASLRDKPGQVTVSLAHLASLPICSGPESLLAAPRGTGIRIKFGPGPDSFATFVVNRLGRTAITHGWPWQIREPSVGCALSVEVKMISVVMPGTQPKLKLCSLGAVTTVHWTARSNKGLTLPIKSGAVLACYTRNPKEVKVIEFCARPKGQSHFDDDCAFSVPTKEILCWAPLPAAPSTD